MASSELLHKLEKDRLRDLNDRTLCISPHKLDKLPNCSALRGLGFSFQSMSWNGKAHKIFIIFGDYGKASHIILLEIVNFIFRI